MNDYYIRLLQPRAYREYLDRESIDSHDADDFLPDDIATMLLTETWREETI